MKMTDYIDEATEYDKKAGTLEIGSEVHIDIFDNRIEIYSPGGMYDGSHVQDLNTNNVPSRRRNPVIADVFSCMNYTERRGSGFKKINADHKAAINYTDELALMYYSDSSTFRVTLYNLNYNVPVENNDGGNDGVNSQNDGVKLNSTQKKIVQAIRENPFCAIGEMSLLSGVKRRAVERNIKTLRENGIIDRQGADKNGLWVLKILNN